MSMVFHVPGIGGDDWRSCFGRDNHSPPWFQHERMHCMTCTCPPPPQPTCPNGTYVTCGVCHQLGIVPDDGHELEFMPPGTKISNDGKTYIWSPV